MNQSFRSFIEIVDTFLLEAALEKSPFTCCLAVAGPVTDNQVTFTNRDGWSVDGKMLSKRFGISKVRIVNDFLSVGYGLLTLDEGNECKLLQRGGKNATGPIACIGAGTGLGECYLTPDHNSDEYFCFSSEGGHVDFSPRNAVEVGLVDYLKQKFSQKNRISVERVVSGTGLVNIYEYLSMIRPDDVDPKIQTQIEAAGDMKGAVIASNPTNKLCKETMRIFAAAYGAEAGNACLRWLPLGGLYLTGGLTPKNIDLISNTNGPFLKAMLDKGRMNEILKTIPVYAVLVEDLGERGAHRLAFLDYHAIRSGKLPRNSKLNSRYLFTPPFNIGLLSGLVLGAVVMYTSLKG